MEERNCLLCGSHDFERLIPSIKHNYRSGGFYIHDSIALVICKRCGLVFENPQVPENEYEEYSDKHYYSAKRNNPPIRHDQRQRNLCPYRWSVLEKNLPWEKFKKVIDIGATGAWSHFIKGKYPAIESVLLEPSEDAVQLCQSSYPDVVAIKSTFESYEDANESYDCIFMFYSVYMFKNPLECLQKAYRLLRPGGKIVIVVSHVLMRVRIWEADPFADLSHLIRSVPLVYFTRTTLARFVEKAGFYIDDCFVAQHFDSLPQKGRQDYFLIAGKHEQPNTNVQISDNETDAVKDLILGFCDKITDKSVKLFAGTNADRFKKAVILHQDQEYYEYVLNKLKINMPGLDVSGINVDTPPDYAALINDEPDTVFLCACLRDFDFGKMQNIYKNSTWIDCFVGNDMGNVYGYWVKASDGRMIPAKSFCPVKEPGSDIYPFNDIAVNDYHDHSSAELSPKEEPGWLLSKIKKLKKLLG